MIETKEKRFAATRFFSVITNEQHIFSYQICKWLIGCFLSTYSDRFLDLVPPYMVLQRNYHIPNSHTSEVEHVEMSWNVDIWLLLFHWSPCKLSLACQEMSAMVDLSVCMAPSCMNHGDANVQDVFLPATQYMLVLNLNNTTTSFKIIMSRVDDSR